MTWPGWVALAVALVVLAAPVGVGSTRAGGLVVDGRLAGATSGRRGRRRAISTVPARALIPVGALPLAAVALTAGPLLAVAAGAVLATGGVLGADVVRARTAMVRHRMLLSCVGVVVGELEAGARPADALAAAASVERSAATNSGNAFARAATAAHSGDDAGAVLAADVDPDVQVVGLAWQLGSTTGSALADVLARVGADFAAADEQRRTVSVALAGPRSSALLLSGLPLLGIALGAAMGARPVPFLIGDPIGRVLCCAGVLLDAAGLLWMRGILRTAARS